MVISAYHRVEASEGCTDSETSEAALSDGGIDDTPLTEAVEKAFGDLVGAVVLGDLLAEDEDLVFALELLSQGLVQRISDGVLLDASALSV